MVEEARNAVQTGQEDTDRALSTVQAERERLGRMNEEAAREIRELRRAVIPGGHPPAP